MIDLVKSVMYRKAKASLSYYAFMAHRNLGSTRPGSLAILN
jgi:hypothetical protein